MISRLKEYSPQSGICEVVITRQALNCKKYMEDFSFLFKQRKPLCYNRRDENAERAREMKRLSQP